MKLKLANVLILAGLMGLMGCDPKATMSTKFLQGEKEQTSATGQLALTLEVVDDIELALVEKGGLTVKEAATIKQGALAGLNNSSQSLSLASDTQTIDQTLPLVVQGALTAMKDENAGLSLGHEKVDVASLILGTTMSSMGQKSTDLDSELRQKVPHAVMTSGVQTLDEGGVEAAFMGPAVGGLSGAGIAAMDDGKFGEDEHSLLVVTMVEASVGSLKETGSKKSHMKGILKDLMLHSVKNLDDGGIDKAKVADFTGTLTQTTMKNIKNTGLDSVAQIKSATGSVMAGAMLGVKDAGLESDEDIAKALDKSLAGAIGGASKAGVKSEKMHLVMDQAVKQAVTVLPEIGITSAKSLETMAVSAARSAIDQFSAVGIQNNEKAREAASSVAHGAMAAVGEFNTKGLIDGNGTATISNSIASIGVKTLYEQAKKSGYSDSMTQVSNQFTTGMVNGLAEAGLPASEIRTTTAALKESVKKGLQETNSLSEQEIEVLAAQASFAAETWVNDMKIHCESAKGIWDAAREVCTYPQEEPVAGANLPSEEDENRCFDQGGDILFHTDGTFFCDIPQGEGLADAASCGAAGYQWALGPEGAYCETLKLPSACWGQFDSQSCQTNTGCAWVGDYCESAEYVTCDAYAGEASCRGDATCSWNGQVAVCEENICDFDPSAGDCPAIDGSGLVVTSATETTINLTWNESLDAYGYVLAIQANSQPADCQTFDATIGVITQTTTSVTDLIPGRTYGVRVCAVRDATGGQPSAGISLTTTTVADTVAPTIAAIQVVSSQNFTYGLGDQVYILVTFSENVFITGSDQATWGLNMTNGGTAYYSAVDSTDPDGAMFIYHPTGSDNGGALEVDYLGVIPPNTSVTDVGGNGLDLTMPVGPYISSANVKVDGSVPSSASSLVITEGAITTSATLNFSFTAGSDGGNNVVHHTMLCPDNSCSAGSCLAGTTLASGVNTGSFASLSDGTYHLCVKSEDPAGNFGSYVASSATVIDTVAPTNPTGLSITSGLIASSLSIQLSFTSGTDANLASHEVKLCGASDCATSCAGAQTINAPTTSATLTAGGEGFYYACVQAADSAGQVSNGIASSQIEIDTTPPSVISVSSSNADGAYTVGDFIYLDISFTENVTVTTPGDLALLLETGSTDQTAVYNSGTGTNTLTFKYTVQASDISADLDYQSSSALSLGTSGQITDAAGNPAALALPTPGSGSSLAGSKAITVDTQGPTLTSVDLAIEIQDGFLNQVDATLTTAVGSVTGNDYDNVGYALISDGSTCDDSVTFSGTVPFLNDGTFTDGLSFDLCVELTDLAGNPAAYGVSANAITVDTTSPSFTNFALTSELGDGYLNAIENASSNVVGTLTASGYDMGEYAIVSSAATCNGSVSPFDAMPQLNDAAFATDGDYKICIKLTDNALNPPTYGESSAFTFDSTPPTMASSITIDQASPHNSTTITLTYDPGTDATGINSHYERACTDSGCSTSCTTGLTDLVDGMTYYGCVKVEDLAGNFSAYAASGTTISIDATAPNITSVTSTSPNGTYTPGNMIYIDVTFDEVVMVAGSPRLLLETGDTNQYADYSSGSGSATLSFTYTVTSGDSAADLSYVGPTLDLNGGTIRDQANNDANLSLPTPGSPSSLSGSHDLVVDGVGPEFVSFTDQAALGVYGIGATVAIDITMSEVVNVTAATTLFLSNSATADCGAQSGVTVISCDYVVAAGDGNLANLNVTNVSPLSNIVDLNGNQATGTLPTSPNDLASEGIVIDTIAPSVTVTTTDPTPTNSFFTIDVLFDEPVTGFDLADVTVTNGTAANLSGSGGTYSVDINPATDGNVDVSIIASAAQDSAGNTNTASSNLAMTYDTTVNGATGLYWGEGLAYYSYGVTAYWTPSTDPDISTQNVFIYNDSSCTSLDHSYSLSSGTGVQSVTMGGNGTYTFHIETVDTAGNSAFSACSTSIEVARVPEVEASLRKEPSGMVLTIDKASGETSEPDSYLIVKSAARKSISFSATHGTDNYSTIASSVINLFNGDEYFTHIDAIPNDKETFIIGEEHFQSGETYEIVVFGLNTTHDFFSNPYPIQFTYYGCGDGYIAVDTGSSVDQPFCILETEGYDGGVEIEASGTYLSTAYTTFVAAAEACEAAGPGFHLISNHQWMMAANKIAADGSNWTGGTPGSGLLHSGHTDNNPSEPCPVNADPDMAFVEGDCSGTSSDNGAPEQRRTFYLDDQMIWDFGGNRHEWVNYVVETGRMSLTANNWYNTDTLTGDGTYLKKIDIYPASWSASNGLGYFISATDPTKAAMLRGAAFDTTAGSEGLYFSDLRHSTTTTVNGAGARCVRDLYLGGSLIGSINRMPGNIDITVDPYYYPDELLVVKGIDAPSNELPTDFQSTSYNVNNLTDAFSIDGNTPIPSYSDVNVATDTNNYYYSFYEPFSGIYEYIGTMVASPPPNAPTCPTGYIYVPGHDIAQVNHFCVMETEAKNGGGGMPESTPANPPLTNLSYEDASARCDALGLQSSLINFDQWVRIAALVAEQGSNWDGGIGVALFTGHTDNNPSQTCPANYDNVQGACGTLGSEPLQRRTFSVGPHQIWDLSGNAAEWVKYIHQGDGTNFAELAPADPFFETYGDPFSIYPSLTSSGTPYDSSNKLGKYHNPSGSYYALMGASFKTETTHSVTDAAGVLSYQGFAPGAAPQNDMGFRCVQTITLAD